MPTVALGRPCEDSAAWLRAVVSLCASHEFGWAVWTYHQSYKALVTGATSSERLRQWDCSPHVAALGFRRFNCTEGTDPLKMLPPSITPPVPAIVGDASAGQRSDRAFYSGHGAQIDGLCTHSA